MKPRDQMKPCEPNFRSRPFSTQKMRDKLHCISFEHCERHCVPCQQHGPPLESMSLVRRSYDVFSLQQGLCPNYVSNCREVGRKGQQPTTLEPSIAAPVGVLARSGGSTRCACTQSKCDETFQAQFRITKLFPPPFILSFSLTRERVSR